MSTELDELETDLRSRPNGNRGARVLRNTIRNTKRKFPAPRPKWKHQLAMAKMVATKAAAKKVTT